ncbi:MAG TPA: hypothetical protein VGM47_02725 [Gammaproteobacteria bacterium]|jgi:hypothetical protein
MEVTNVREEQRKEYVRWTVAGLFAVWLAIFAGVGFYGGLFKSSPEDMPAGMMWENAETPAASFYILRDGHHLILELNHRSQLWWIVLLTALAVILIYSCSQGLRGRLKNRNGQPLPTYGQALMSLFLGLMALVVLWFWVGSLLKNETLDLDPAKDSVMLDGVVVGPFTQLVGFRFHAIQGPKGATIYELVMEERGHQAIQIGGNNGHTDLEQVALYLNGYLSEERQTPAGKN